MMRKILALFFLLNSIKIFCWTVSVHNFSNEVISVGIGSSDNYPCGHWYAAYLDDWCNCGTRISVGPKNTNSFSYSGACAPACTTYINIYDSKGNQVTDSGKLVVGLGACSSVEVWTGKGSDGNWWITKSDWTNKFTDWANDQVIPLLERTFNDFTDFDIAKIVDSATKAADTGDDISAKLNELTKSVQGPIDIGNNIANEVNTIKDQINKFSKDTGVTIQVLQENFETVLKGDYIGAIAALLTKFTNINEIIEKGKILFTDIKTTHDKMLDTLDNVDLKPLLNKAQGFLSTIKILVENIAIIIDSVPPDIIGHDIVRPLYDAAQSLDRINDSINKLQDSNQAPLYKPSEIEKKLMNGIFNNINNIGNIVNKIKDQIGLIQSNVKKLTDKSIPNVKTSVKTLTNVLNPPNSSLKSNLLSKLRSPENIAKMIPIVMSALPAAVITLGSFGTLSGESARIVTEAAKPLIRGIIRDLLKEIQILVFVENINGLITNIADLANQAIQTFNIFKTDINVDLMPEQTFNIVTKIINDVNQIQNDVTNINAKKLTLIK